MSVIQSSSPLPPAQPEIVRIPAELMDCYSVAMDQALGIGKTSLKAVSEWNTQAIELAISYAPVFCRVFGLAFRTAASYLQWACGALALYHTQMAYPQLAATGGTLMRPIEGETAEDLLARCMDIATGDDSAPADLDVELITIATVVKMNGRRLPAQAEKSEAGALVMAHVA